MTDRVTESSVRIPDERPSATSAERLARSVSRRALLATLGLTAVVLYGAVLRLDALTQMYGPVSSPVWLQRLQQSRMGESALRPRAMTWTAVPTYPHVDGPPTRYRSDPYTYLKYAREMRSFYAAHHREPLFPFATKVFLWLFDQQDVAVSFASAAFSIVAIVGTYLLGALAFSRLVGLTAALALAVEYEVIGWSVAGWRDDAFTAAVLLCACSMLKYRRSPSRTNAVLMGAVAGLACLVRITSLSFIVPGLAFLLLLSGRPWKARVSEVGLGAITGAAILAPYVVNCWLTFDDPLYAINVHADVYTATEAQAGEVSQSAGEYIRRQFRAHPVRTVDTFILGMTSYPFTNKWRGFDQWANSLGTWLSRASLLGLLLFIGSGAGRLLLVVLAGSLLPYAFTWRLISDWRFTEHAYPFFLIAACFAVGEVLTLLFPSRLRARLDRYRGLKPALATAAVVVTTACVAWAMTHVLPPMIVEEALRSDENVSIVAGERDAAFFVEGWSGPVRQGNITTRAAHGPYSVMNVPLPVVREYDMTVRLDPHPRPIDGTEPHLPTVVVFINNNRLTSLDMVWNPQRVGAYDIRVPAALIKPGINRVAFMSESGSRFMLWYLRIRPRQ
jgi:4-amino-4-deoxy-L-arabinose transferase-like glycosyltransferase